MMWSFREPLVIRSFGELLVYAALAVFCLVMLASIALPIAYIGLELVQGLISLVL